MRVDYGVLSDGALFVFVRVALRNLTRPRLDDEAVVEFRRRVRGCAPGVLAERFGVGSEGMIRFWCEKARV